MIKFLICTILVALIGYVGLLIVDTLQQAPVTLSPKELSLAIVFGMSGFVGSLSMCPSFNYK